MSNKNDTTVAPLSPIDHGGLTTTSIIYGYVVKSLDDEKLKTAMTAVTEKWRLIAGRVEVEETGTYCIRFPTGKSLPEEYARFTFTNAEYPTTSLDVAGQQVNTDTAAILPRPSFKYFCHPSTPYALSAFASQKCPLISIHVSRLQNCVCIGISFPHGAFDSTGMGMIVKTLDAELNGKDWSPPAVDPVSIVATAYQEFKENPPQPSEGIANLRKNLSALGVGSGAMLGGTEVYERLWHGCQDGIVFMGENVLNKIVARVKKQVLDEGKGWVSTADVLVAWILKAAYIEETSNTNTLAFYTTMSMRSIFTNPAFADYPHNAFCLISPPHTPIKIIASASLADLSLLHRQIIADNRNQSYVEAYRELTASLGNHIIPTTTWTAESWACTNQVSCRADNIDFGTETYRFYSWLKPYMPHHGFIINKFKDGYILELTMRKSRLDSIAREVERLNQGREPQVL